jgi:serpin B
MRDWERNRGGLRLIAVRSIRLLGVVVVIAMAAAACGGEQNSGPTTSPARNVDAGGASTSVSEPFVDGELVAVDLPRSQASVTDEELKAVVQGDRALGLDLLRVSGGDDNLMVSPYSVATALSMLYPGARGQTAEEISDVMHLTVDDEILHEVRSAIDSDLGSVPESDAEDDTRRPFELRPANSAWGQGGYPFLEPYLETLATYYGAGLRVVDFAEPELATSMINDWTEEATEGRIPDLIPTDAINEMTRLVLVNAIWFQANWASQFQPELTEEGSFNLIDGSQVTVPFMHREAKTEYAETEGFRAIRLPYAGEAAMIVVLPKTQNPSELLETLKPKDLDWRVWLVDLALPQFRFESELPLKDSLQALGMTAAFTPPLTGADDEADFTGIRELRTLFVSDAFHSASIAVDENGTEAAAATAIVMEDVSSAESTTFTVDRPFVFWIEHTPTGTPLFIGQVTNPTIP